MNAAGLRHGKRDGFGLYRIAVLIGNDTVNLSAVNVLTHRAGISCLFDFGYHIGIAAGITISPVVSSVTMITAVQAASRVESMVMIPLSAENFRSWMEKNPCSVVVSCCLICSSCFCATESVIKSAKLLVNCMEKSGCADTGSCDA